MKHSKGNKFADIFFTIRKILAILLICAAGLGLVVFGAGLVMMKMGEFGFRKISEGRSPNLVMEPPGEADPEQPDPAPFGGDVGNPVVWKEGWVRYNGKIYEYNEHILTFLLLGIDEEGKVSANKTLTDGGQADAIFLVVVNPDTKEISLIGVNRDTIVDVLMVGIGENGEDIRFPSQIAVQHGFGDGLSGSCEMTRDRVSELFYDLPIHAYVSFNMGGIADMNDAVGGVEVTVPEDLTKKNKAWTEGAQVTLKGKDAFWFVKWRDTEVFESARGRLERQKLYSEAFVKKLISATKKDITVPVTLYGNSKEYIVTDLTADKITYLSGELANYSFNDHIYTLEGTTRMKGEHEAFYPDEQALKELILQVFYYEVEL